MAKKKWCAARNSEPRTDRVRRRRADLVVHEDIGDVLEPFAESRHVTATRARLPVNDIHSVHWLPTFRLNLNLCPRGDECYPRYGTNRRSVVRVPQGGEGRPRGVHWGRTGWSRRLAFGEAEARVEDLTDEAPVGLVEITGVIKWFDVSKGYGFIVPDNGMRGCPAACDLPAPRRFSDRLRRRARRLRGARSVEGAAGLPHPLHGRVDRDASVADAAAADPRPSRRRAGSSAPWSNGSTACAASAS